MLKKILALAAAAALALSLSACGGTAVKLPALEQEVSSTASGGAEPVRKKPDSSKYDDTLLGLLSYMEDGGAVARDTERVTFDNGSIVIEDGVTSFVQMSYKEIGAVNGYRYLFTFNKSTVQAEFYEFDLENLNEKAEACIANVKEKGFFEILDNEVPAVLSASGKYLMIYTDPRTDEVSAAQKEWAQELFLGFRTESAGTK